MVEIPVRGWAVGVVVALLFHQDVRRQILWGQEWLKFQAAAWLLVLLWPAINCAFISCAF